MIELNSTVMVKPQLQAGMNAPGGVGRVIHAHSDGHFDVKYILGGWDKRVPAEIISEYDIDASSDRRTRRTSRSKTVTPTVGPTAAGGPADDTPHGICSKRTPAKKSQNLSTASISPTIKAPVPTPFAIGTKVLKKFDSKFYKGEVKQLYNAEDESEPTLYHVVYEDGDNEDLDHEELEVVLEDRSAIAANASCCEATLTEVAGSRLVAHPAVQALHTKYGATFSFSPPKAENAKPEAPKLKPKGAKGAAKAAAKAEKQQAEDQEAQRQHDFFVENYVESSHAENNPMSKTRAKQFFCLADDDFVSMPFSGWENAGYSNFKVYDRRVLLQAALRKHGGVLKFTQKRLKKMDRKRKASARVQQEQSKRAKATLPLSETDSDVAYGEPGSMIEEELKDTLRDSTEYDWRRRHQIHKIISKPVRQLLSQGVKEATAYLTQGRPSACHTVLSACTRFCLKKGEHIQEHEPVDCFKAAIPPLTAAWRKLQAVDHTSSGSKHIQNLESQFVRY